MVGNVYDRKALFFQIVDDAEKPLHFFPRQCRSGLVHDEYARVVPEHFGYFDELRLVLADVFNRKHRIELEANPF